LLLGMGTGLSLMTWFGLVRVRCYSSKAPVFLWPLLSCSLTPVLTILRHFRPAFGILPKTGDAEPVDQGNLVENG